MAAWSIDTPWVLRTDDRAGGGRRPTLDKARGEGFLPFDALDDRARPVSQLPAWNSPAEIVRACAHQYRSDWWADADPLRGTVGREGRG